MMLSHGILKVQETTKHSEACMYYFCYHYITSLYLLLLSRIFNACLLQDFISWYYFCKTLLLLLLLLLLLVVVVVVLVGW